MEWSAEPLNTEPLCATSASTVVLCRTSVCVHLSVSRFHTRMEVSYEPEKQCEPDTHRLYTAPVCPFRMCSISSVSMFQI